MDRSPVALFGQLYAVAGKPLSYVEEHGKHAENNEMRRYKYVAYNVVTVKELLNTVVKRDVCRTIISRFVQQIFANIQSKILLSYVKTDVNFRGVKYTSF